MKTTRKWRLTAYKYELWGNLKDGFDVNNVYKTSVNQTHLKPPSERQLMCVAKDAFEGMGFALNESKSTYVPRGSVRFDDHYNLNICAESEIYFQYRGQQIGYVKIEEIEELPTHYTARVMSAKGGIRPQPIQIEPCASRERLLMDAKTKACAHSLDRIEIDKIDKTGRLLETIEYEWRNKGDEFIGQPGDKTSTSGWFNLSK